MGGTWKRKHWVRHVLMVILSGLEKALDLGELPSCHREARGLVGVHHPCEQSR